MAEAASVAPVVHESARSTASHPIVQPCPPAREPDAPAAREHGLTHVVATGLARVLLTGRGGASALVVVLLLAAGGGGVGGSWLLGPGGLSDRDRDAIAENARAQVELAAALERLERRVQSCELDVDEQADRAEWSQGALIVTTEALVELGRKLDAPISVRLPPLPARRRR